MSVLLPRNAFGDVVQFKKARKVKNVMAKPVSCVIHDTARSLLEKVLFAAIEGNEVADPSAILCMGEFGDVWQQRSDKFLKAYEIVSFDSNGWMVGKPRPEAERNAIQVDCDSFKLIQDYVNAKTPGQDSECDLRLEDALNFKFDFQIVAQWGKAWHDGTQRQFGEIGDFVLNNPADPLDMWIVKKRIFESTYVVLPETT